MTHLRNGDDVLDPPRLNQFLDGGGDPSHPFSFFSGLSALGIDSFVLTASGQDSSPMLFGSPTLPGDADRLNEVKELSWSNSSEPISNEKHLFTPLHLAAMAGNRQSIEMLLNRGADINRKDSKGRVAREVAHPSVLDIFVEKIPNVWRARMDQQQHSTQANLKMDVFANTKGPAAASPRPESESTILSTGKSFVYSTIEEPSAPLMATILMSESSHEPPIPQYNPGSMSVTAQRPLPVVSGVGTASLNALAVNVIDRVARVLSDSNFPYPSELALELFAFLVLAAQDASIACIPGRSLQMAADALLTFNWVLACEFEEVATGKHTSPNQPAQTLLLWRIIELSELIDLCPQEHDESRRMIEHMLEQNFLNSMLVLNEYLTASGKACIQTQNAMDDCAAWKLGPQLLFSLIYHEAPYVADGASSLEGSPEHNGHHERDGEECAPQVDTLSGAVLDEWSSQSLPLSFGRSENLQQQESADRVTEIGTSEFGLGPMRIRLEVLTPKLLQSFYEIYAPDKLHDISQALRGEECNLRMLCQSTQRSYPDGWDEYIRQNIQPVYDQLVRTSEELLEMSRELDELDGTQKETIVTQLGAGLTQLVEWGARETSSCDNGEITELDRLLGRFLMISELTDDLLPDADE